MTDVKCRSLTAPWIRHQAREDPTIETCSYFESLESNTTASIPSGVYTLDDFKSHAKQSHLCPYFLARKLIPQANVVIFSYHYLLDPKVASIVSKEFGKECVVVFDEAHNIDNVCTEALGVDLTRGMMERGSRSLGELEQRVLRYVL